MYAAFELVGSQAKSEQQWSINVLCRAGVGPMRLKRDGRAELEADLVASGGANSSSRRAVRCAAIQLHFDRRRSRERERKLGTRVVTRMTISIDHRERRCGHGSGRQGARCRSCSRLSRFRRWRLVGRRQWDRKREKRACVLRGQQSGGCRVGRRSSEG